MNPGKAMFCRSIKYALVQSLHFNFLIEIVVANVVGMVYSLIVQVEKNMFCRDL